MLVKQAEEWRKEFAPYPDVTYYAAPSPAGAGLNGVELRSHEVNSAGSRHLDCRASKRSIRA